MRRRPKLTKNYVIDESTKETKAYMKLINPVLFETQACCSEETLDAIVGLVESTTKEFIGTSRPDEEDEYNEMIGKDIAGMKSDLKYHLYMTKKYLSLCGKLNKACEELALLAQYHYNKTNNIVADMNNRYL